MHDLFIFYWQFDTVPVSKPICLFGNIYLFFFVHFLPDLFKMYIQAEQTAFNHAFFFPCDKRSVLKDVY